MNSAIACFLAVSLLLVSQAAFAQPKASETPSIVAVGEGVIKVAPDQAFVTIAAESRAKTPKEAQQANAEAMSAVQDRLKAARLGENAIRTLIYDLQPEFDFLPNSRRVLKGYVARNAIEVKIDEINRVGEILDLAVHSGATNVQNIRFDVKRRDQLQREALKQAVQDARSKAEAAAAGAGQTIASILRIEEQSLGDQPPRPMVMAMRAEAADVRQTPIEAGQIEISARVVLTAALK